jgi:hypothetical protein
MYGERDLVVLADFHELFTHDASGEGLHHVLNHRTAPDTHWTLTGFVYDLSTFICGVFVEIWVSDMQTVWQTDTFVPVPHAPVLSELSLFTLELLLNQRV